MNKPIKPKKIIDVVHTATYDFNWVSKKVSLDDFQEWIKETVPHKATDVTLELCEDFEYDNQLTWLEVGWTTKEPNPYYLREMKKYETKLRKWKKNESAQISKQTLSSV